MKSRIGFVSNSSSSSFILSSPNRPMKINYSISIPINDLIEHRIKTIPELDKYFLDYTGCKTMEEFKEGEDFLYQDYLECKKEIEKGRIILIGCVRNDNSSLEVTILENKLDTNLSKEFKVIKDAIL